MALLALFECPVPMACCLPLATPSTLSTVLVYRRSSSLTTEDDRRGSPSPEYFLLKASYACFVLLHMLHSESSVTIVPVELVGDEINCGQVYGSAVACKAGAFHYLLIFTYRPIKVEIEDSLLIFPFLSLIPHSLLSNTRRTCSFLV